MESLNLHTLASSLPTAQQNAEKELANNFKAAALSITNLYRSSRQNSKRAYNSGYAAACQDLLTMIQQGVSLNQPGLGYDAEGGLTIGRVMDWIEARLEAIKSREEEEDEEEEREREKDKDKEGARPARVAPGVTAAPASAASKAHGPAGIAEIRSKDHIQPRPSLPTPCSPVTHSNPQLPSEPSSPSPPPRSVPKGTRTRLQPKTEPYPSPALSGVESVPSAFPSAPPPFSDIPIPIAAGAKRRHAMMMMLDSSSAPVTINGGPSSTTSPGLGLGNNIAGVNGNGSVNGRRRTRSSRSAMLHQSQSQNIVAVQAASEAMDVEEDGGRERKRVARR